MVVSEKPPISIAPIAMQQCEMCCGVDGVRRGTRSMNESGDSIHAFLDYCGIILTAGFKASVILAASVLRNKGQKLGELLC